MKILYIHQYFKTPDTGGGLRSYYLAKDLVERGHAVEMITAHSSSSYKHTVVEGISVHYLPVSYDNKFGKIRRVYAFMKFIVLAILKSTRLGKIDLCYVMTTPLTTGFIALYNKWVLSRPYIFEVGDLWPAVPIEMGVLKHPLLIRCTRLLEAVFYRKSIGLVGLSRDISKHLGTMEPNKALSTIPNIADCQYFSPGNKPGDLVHKYATNGDFVISYVGTLGKANNLVQLLSAAEAVMDLPVHFLIVGTGAEKDFLKKHKEDRLLENVTFLDHQDKKGVKQVLDESDAVYLSFLPLPVICSGSPNKLFDGLAAGKAIISNFQGWTKELIETHDLGFVYDPQDVEGFRTSLLALISDAPRLNRIALSSRKLAVEAFSLEILGQRLEEFLRSVSR